MINSCNTPDILASPAHIVHSSLTHSPFFEDSRSLHNLIVSQKCIPVKVHVVFKDSFGILKFVFINFDIAF